MPGTTWVEESGFLEGPVAITNTHSVGVVRDALIAWSVKRSTNAQAWSLPVVAETWDGYLNDINGVHVKPDHVFSAMERHGDGMLRHQRRHRHGVARVERGSGRLYGRGPGAVQLRPAAPIADRWSPSGQGER